MDDNKVVGTHDGHCFYTIGQRKGLGLGGPGGPWFVAGKDVNNNIVYVVEGEKHPALYTDELIATDIELVGPEISFPVQLKAKVRYRQDDQECTIYKLEDDKYLVKFVKPQRAIAIRQSVVFYDEKKCLGGAIIAARGKSLFEKANNPIESLVH